MLPVLYEFPRRCRRTGGLARPEELADGDAERRALDHDRAPGRGVRDARRRRGRAARVGVAAPEHRDRPRAALGRWAGATSGSSRARDGITLDESSRAARWSTSGSTAAAWTTCSACGVGRDREDAASGSLVARLGAPVGARAAQVRGAALPDFEADGDLTIVEKIGETSTRSRDRGAVEDAGCSDKVGVDPAGIGGVLDALVDAGIAAGEGRRHLAGLEADRRDQDAERKLAEGALMHAASR
jgi:hypothetical protein